jgi:SAM-dependent methyltransferase
LVQASVYELPFRAATFDGCYCIGVVQHTPDPAMSIASIPPLLKPGGRLALTMYERRRFSKLYSKYLVRPVTSRLDPATLLTTIEGAMPVLFPVTEILFRVPVVGRAFRFAIPVANYVEQTKLTTSQRYRWAILDTFDMLSPRYDQPQTLGQVERTLREAAMVEIQRLPNAGLNVVAKKPCAGDRAVSG